MAGLAADVAGPGATGPDPVVRGSAVHRGTAGRNFPHSARGARASGSRVEGCDGLRLFAGVRFDDFSLIEFRWTRSTSALRFGAPFAFLRAAIGDVTLNQFHADFTRELVIPEVKGLRSFFTGSLGPTHLGTAQDGFSRFSFGFGAGLKQFLGSRLAIRAEAEWFPILVEPSVGGLACGTISSAAVLWFSMVSWCSSSSSVSGRL